MLDYYPFCRLGSSSSISSLSIFLWVRVSCGPFCNSRGPPSLLGIHTVPEIPFYVQISKSTVEEHAVRVRDSIGLVTNEIDLQSSYRSSHAASLVRLEPYFYSGLLHTPKGYDGDTSVLLFSDVGSISAIPFFLKSYHYMNYDHSLLGRQVVSLSDAGSSICEEEQASSR